MRGGEPSARVRDAPCRTISLWLGGGGKGREVDGGEDESIGGGGEVWGSLANPRPDPVSSCVWGETVGCAAI